MSHGLHGEAGERSTDATVAMPAPTFWPMVLAFGIALLLAGLVTHYIVSLTGLVITLRSIVGWWREVIPLEAHEALPIEPHLRPAPIRMEERSVIRLQVGEGQHRIRVPERIHPYSSGFWGGLAGGAVMAALACLYGLIAEHSIWYPINLLAGVVLPSMGSASLNQLRSFDLVAFVVAFIGHGVLSVLMGTLYAAILPMFPKYAPLWGGILMPLFWSGLIATTLAILNPALNGRISWPWFVACQLGFGLVGGFVIARSTSISTMQSWGFAERAFIDAPGVKRTSEENRP